MSGTKTDSYYIEGSQKNTLVFANGNWTYTIYTKSGDEWVVQNQESQVGQESATQLYFSTLYMLLDWELNIQDEILATEEWVEGQGYLSSIPNTYKTYSDTISSLSNDGYVTTTQLSESLPYALVTPGEWKFSDGVARELTLFSLSEESFAYGYLEQGGYRYSQSFDTRAAAQTASYLIFDSGITATRNHLLDRAINNVEISSVTTLTLPEAVNSKARDFLVRVTIPSGTTVAGLITFAGYDGETLTYETDDDSFPEPDDVGTWLYSFTETTAHTFAVSLKSVSIVTQGGNA